MKTTITYNLKPKCWYNEYHGGGIRIHDYFTFMINQFPIFAIRKFDDPHSDYYWCGVDIALFGMDIYILKREESNENSED